MKSCASLLIWNTKSKNNLSGRKLWEKSSGGAHKMLLTWGQCFSPADSKKQNKLKKSPLWGYDWFIVHVQIHINKEHWKYQFICLITFMWILLTLLRGSKKGLVSATWKRSHQWCVSLTPNNTKTIGRMTCHCFLQPIRRDLPERFYNTVKKSSLQLCGTSRFSWWASNF